MAYEATVNQTQYVCCKHDHEQTQCTSQALIWVGGLLTGPGRLQDHYKVTTVFEVLTFLSSVR